MVPLKYTCQCNEVITSLDYCVDTSSHHLNGFHVLWNHESFCLSAWRSWRVLTE